MSATVALSGRDTTTRDASGGNVRGFVEVVQHHDHKHAGSRGHLQATVSNVERVSTLALENPRRKKLADVAVHAGYAYLAAWAGPTCERNGVHVVDLRDPARPRKIGFIAVRAGSYPGEGVQALRLETASFRGDVLVTNNETCDRGRPLGGLNLYDVSDPRRPRVLVEGFGDRSGPGSRTTATAHEIHSVFAWDAGERAYAVLVDNRESRNVDIVDITRPNRPRLVAEYDLARRFPQIRQARPANLVDVFHHDVVVKQIGARQVMLVSYWDGGYVKLDVTNPRRARYLADSDFATVDPELAAQARLQEAPEGNAHQSELTSGDAYLIAADEDFGPTGLEATADDSGRFPLARGNRAREIPLGSSVAGGTRYVGRACEEDPPVPPAAGATFAVVSRGVCPFSAKLARVGAAGYEAALVVNEEGPEACGLFRMAAQSPMPAFSVSRATGFGLFDRPGYDAAACRTGRSDLLPGVDLGADGDRVSIRHYFDGWGYVHLFRNGTGKLRQLDTYAIPEAMDARFASGSGDLSVHEVATSHERARLAYLSYYAGGLRVIRIEDDRIVEVGRYIDVAGNNLWGVQVFSHEGREYVAASDIDFGLYVFRYTGD